MADAMHYDYPRDVTPQEIWAILREVAEGQKKAEKKADREMQEARERQKEVDRQIQELVESQKRTGLQLEETDRLIKKTTKQIKENGRQFGYLNNRFGELAEHLVAPNIVEKFNALGFTFEKAAANEQIKDTVNKRIAEIDILLENANTVMAVEVKAKPKESDVDNHVKRMEILRQYADAQNDKRIFHGALAGAIMEDSVRNYILQNGFYAIEQTGDTVKINIPEGFKPRHW